MKVGLVAFVFFVALIISLNQSGLVTKDNVIRILKENKDWLRKAGITGSVAVIITDIVFIMFCFPGSFFIELFCGSVYGFGYGVLAVLVAKNIAAILCFMLGKTLLKNYVANLAAKNGLFKNFLNETKGASGLFLVLAGRLSPLPSYVCNYGFSTTSVSVQQYAVATLVAGTPMILQNVYMGSLAYDTLDIGGMSGDKRLSLCLMAAGTLVTRPCALLPCCGGAKRADLNWSESRLPKQAEAPCA